jgi:hypothetical protein
MEIIDRLLVLWLNALGGGTATIAPLPQALAWSWRRLPGDIDPHQEVLPAPSGQELGVAAIGTELVAVAVSAFHLAHDETGLFVGMSVPAPANGDRH